MRYKGDLEMDEDSPQIPRDIEYKEGVSQADEVQFTDTIEAYKGTLNRTANGQGQAIGQGTLHCQ
jgi:hypothetical protein